MKRAVWFVLCMWVVLLTACGGGVKETPTPTPSPTGVDGGVITGSALVDSVEVLLLESFPIQVRVVARGNLPDTCTEVAEITKKRDGNTFTAAVATSRPADRACGQMLVPFEETFPLDVAGLPAGSYTVTVNGVSATFEFTVDNRLVEPGTDAAPVNPLTSGEAEAVPPLIPREVLFGNPDKVSAGLSPDGTKVSFLAPVEGVMNVWVGPASDPAAARPVTADRNRGITYYGWAYTSQHILYRQDQAGDENWRIYSLNLDTGRTVNLTPLDGVMAYAQAISHKFPEEILVGINDRMPQIHDLYRVNINTGERTLLLENEGFASFVVDDEYRVRLAARMTPTGGSQYFHRSEQGTWEPFLDIAMEDVLTTGVVGFDRSGSVVYMIDSRGRNTASLVSLDLDDGKIRVIAEDPRADISGALVHPTEKTVQAVAFTYERKHWQVIDESIAEELAYLSTVADGDVEVISRTRDDQHWMVLFIVDDGPVGYYIYDRQARQARFLFTHQPELEGLPLAKMHPTVIQSRDGLDLVSYYTLPKESDRDGDGVPESLLPMVLVVHGGPWSRDAWGYNPLHQWLANRGYAALSVNFRGSTGFGKDFINASTREWGGKMHDDLIDAVNWAVGEKIADASRVAIAGGSYGGYATLWAMTNTPETFACGVDIVGPSNLVTLLESIPPYWQPQIELFATRVGDHRTAEGRAFLTQRSPLTYADRIGRPLLIGQGANDPRCKQAESDQIVAALEAKGIPVTYVLYPDEGHGFGRPENSLSFFAVTEAFLSEHLGGRLEAVGDDFEGSTITVPAGVEGVPGLAEALTDMGALQTPP